MEKIYLTMVLSPLIGAIIAGFFGRTLGSNKVSIYGHQDQLNTHQQGNDIGSINKNTH
jgi:phosphate/sulfate permease